jgi:hypothetical protein
MAWRRLGSAAIAAGLGFLCGCSGGTPEGLAIRYVSHLLRMRRIQAVRAGG